MISASTPDIEFKSVSAQVNINVVNDLSIDKYDEIELSQDLHDLLYPNESEGIKYVMIKLIGSAYFDSFKLFKVNSVNNVKGKVVTFLNNSVFHKFRNQITISDGIIETVDISTIPILKQTYVLIPEAMYSILGNQPQDVVRRQFIKCLTTEIVNTGDIIRGINGEVKLCEPLPHGRVDSNTEIIFIKQDDDMSQEEENESEIVEELDDLSIDFELSNYLSHEVEADSVSSAFPVKLLKTKIMINDFPAALRAEDDELFVFMKSDDILKLPFPLFNGDTAKVILDSNDELYVKVFSFVEPTDFESGSIYLSPIFVINLGLKEGSTLRLSHVTNPNAPLTSIIPIAPQATISRVASSITLDKIYQQHFFSNLKYLLNHHMKCIRVGDFIPVVLDSILSRTMFEIESEDETVPMGNPDSVAWFQIVDITGGKDVSTSQYLIDPSKTKLISSGIEFVKLPPNEFYGWYSYLDLPPIFNYNQFDNLKHFAYVSELNKVLKTSLATKLNSIILLNSYSRGAGKSTLINSVALELGLNVLEIDCNEIINPGQELKTIGLLTGKIDKILNNYSVEESPSSVTLIYLKHIENLCVEKNVNDQNASLYISLSLKVENLLNSYLKKYPSNVMVALSCNDFEKLNNHVKLVIKFKIDVTIPNEFERKELFKFLIENNLNKNGSQGYIYSIRNDVNYSSLAVQSAGLNPLDLVSINNNSKKFALRRLRKLSKDSGIHLSDLVTIGSGGKIFICPEDYIAAINDARNQFSDSIGAPKIPDVKWEDIGGLDLVKDEILDTIDMPLKYPELFNTGLKKRSGILFYGPPGTGKTLLAKAIATNFSLNFFSVKGPELLNMYIGESEANVRKVFQRARDAKPCVIFFDELDSVAPKRGNQGDSGGVMDRIVSQLLAELDGMSGGDGDGVFVVGATNRPDLLDEALLRPGRFDKMLYLGISDTDDKQLKILEALTRKFKLADAVNLAEVANRCSFTLTGADFYALCSDSMLNAMTRISQTIDEKVDKYNQKLKSEGNNPISIRWWFDNVATEEDTDVVVQTEDFQKAQDNLVPSVSVDELNHYLRIRENFEGGKDQAQKLAASNEVAS